MINGLLVLAGGSGRRLGTPKAWLEWDGQPLLLRIIDRLSRLALEPPIVVAQPGQELPSGDYRRVDDQIPDSGPLAGLAAGLKRHAKDKPYARIAVIGCDYPFADPKAELWVECDRAVAAGELAVHALLRRVPHHVVDAAEVNASTDLERALLNLNDRDDLRRARAFS
jgi:molybdopterin-guanine dinucleotide biosynthesis protein A